jgi:hypothetical protein
MLTTVAFDNQVPRDAAEVGKVGTNPVLPTEFESAQALGSELRPQLPLLGSQLGTKTPASIARSFVCGTHKSRASEGALIKDPLSAPKEGRRSPPIRGRELRPNVETPEAESRRLSTVILRRSRRIYAKQSFFSTVQANRSALIPRRPLALGSVGMTRGRACRIWKLQRPAGKPGRTKPRDLSSRIGRALWRTALCRNSNSQTGSFAAVRKGPEWACGRFCAS